MIIPLCSLNNAVCNCLSIFQAPTADVSDLSLFNLLSYLIIYIYTTENTDTKLKGDNSSHLRNASW